MDSINSMNHSNRHLILLYLISFLFLCLFVENGFCGENSRKVTIVFRLDDISSKSETNFEVKVFEQFKKRHMPITVSVIPFVMAKDMPFHETPHAKIAALPFMAMQEGGRSRYISPGHIIPLTTNKAEIIKNGMDEGTLEVAMHGYTHQRNRAFYKQLNSEFAGIDYDMQVKMLDEGKSLLENILGEKIRIFVPPWNSYDMNTVHALEKLGFECLSADMPGEIDKSVALKYFPITCSIVHLRDAIDLARKSKDPYPIITVLFHSYDFIEVNKKTGILKMDDFVALMDFISSQNDLRVLSMKHVMETIDDFGPRRYKDNSDFHKILFYTPRILRVFPDKLYLASALANQYKLCSLSILILFYMGILGISAYLSTIIGCIILQKIHFSPQIYKYSGAMVFAIVSGYALRDFSIGYNGAIAIVFSLGICIGIVSAFQKMKKNLPESFG